MMSDMIEIVLERESANDTDATVVEICVDSGTTVGEGDRIFAIETSKAVQDIYAPASGVLVHELTKGGTVVLGIAVARILPPGTVAAPASREAAQPATRAARPAGQEPRLSRAAGALAAAHGLTAADFDADFVTALMVQRQLGLTPAPSLSPPPSAPPVASARDDRVIEETASHKRNEIRSLSQGAGNSMLSVIGTTLWTDDLQRQDTSFFASKIVDLVAFEASRLMPQFRKLNAAWRDTGFEYHSTVSAGIAYDGIGRLMVYGIERSDELSLEDIQDEIMEALKRATQSQLTARELTRATFTITDLSAAAVDYMFPLLPQGQSCIIGITRGATGGHALYVGFDHRVTEGLEVARFLQTLRERLIAATEGDRTSSLQCTYCGCDPTAAEGKGLLRTTDARGQPAWCCRRCWAEA